MRYASKVARNRTPERGRRSRARLHVEELEGRNLLSVYSPAQILHAYGIDQLAFSGGTVPGSGAGQTIAIVDAYYDPGITSDLATFAKTFGLAPLDGKNGDGTFTQVDLSQKTVSPAGDDWTVETALDVEWAHAVAPKANIVLVEAASDNQDPSTGEPTALLNAVKVAATYPGVSVVSMSWGITEVPQETSWDSYFTTPGVTFVAASGDSGAGTIWPAVSPYVVSVGGTTLRLSSSNTISSETGWGNGYWSAYYGGSGGGFSQYEALPSYQQGITASADGFTYTGFGVRLNPDVAYVGNPNTGLYVLDSADGGWFQVGGTSAGAPQWAALVAIADQGRALANLPALSSTQTLSLLYANPGDFHDITQGSTGVYEVVNSAGQVVGQIPVAARPGYDLVTGLGTPVANLLVPTLAGVGSMARTAPLASAVHTPASSSGSGTGHKSQGSASTPTAPATTSGTSAQDSVATGLGNLVAVVATSSAATPAASVLPSSTAIVALPAPAPLQVVVALPPGGGLKPAPYSSGSSTVDPPLVESDEGPAGDEAPAVPPATLPDLLPQPLPVNPGPAPAEQRAPAIPNEVRDAVFIPSAGTPRAVPDQVGSGLPAMPVEPLSLLGMAAVFALASSPEFRRPKPVPELPEAFPRLR